LQSRGDTRSVTNLTSMALNITMPFEPATKNETNMKINSCYHNGIDRSAKTGGPTRYTNPCKRITESSMQETRGLRRGGQQKKRNCKKTLHLTVVNMISESHKKNWEKE